MKSSSLVVFEGLDSAGKTTAHRAVKDLAYPERLSVPPEHDEPIFAEPRPYFTHQPSGGTSPVGKAIYSMTEDLGRELNPKSRQMLHLASHYQHYETDILPRLESGRSVFMDRNYWSTFAYGYFDCLDEHFTPDEFLRMCKAPLHSIEPDLVLFFGHPHEEDHHNTPQVVKGYEHLRAIESYHTVEVPDLSIPATVDFVFRVLREWGITKVYR